ncbi:MAG: carboxynorspermidine decarboxylase [Candidatus Omnitrophica bacterium]|nr:carboxynorspermidine decarboxylase [Candidatus Omnitrophota bacterium]
MNSMNFVKQIKHTPCYVVDLGLLEKNLKVLDSVQERAGCSIILALKGFSMFSTFPLIKKYLKGSTASSLNEATLAYEEFGGEVHVCAPAYRDDEFDELIRMSDHIVFNSKAQWEHFKSKVLNSNKKINCGLRINPEHSEVKVAIYDPCSKTSRLGIKIDDIKDIDLEGINGLHFHTLCELNSDSLQRTLKVVEEKFGYLIHKMEWVNFGGGHHITREDYDIDLLCDIINKFKAKYGVKVYLEPGEAIALNTGYFVSRVLDIIPNEPYIAILDSSCACHMPDVLEMPYRPEIADASMPGEKKYTYKLGGMSCLAGDVIGEYSFDEPLTVGDKLIFKDMAHYTMVKNNTFNGVNLPDIGIYDPEKDKYTVVKKFGYEDYKNRLS